MADGEDFLTRARTLLGELAEFDERERIELINQLRETIHEHSPLRDEPVDFVRWVPAEQVSGNAYNPNTVAPTEKKLLEHSISEDGLTQPIVAWPTGRDLDGHVTFEVVDGFHRNLVVRNSDTVRERVHGMLPISTINSWRADEEDRMAATVRHNRARGQHAVEPIATIALNLYRRRKRAPLQYVCDELGMDEEEARRLMMQGGLGEAYADEEFSRAWDVGVQPLPLHEGDGQG